VGREEYGVKRRQYEDRAYRMFMVETKIFVFAKIYEKQENISYGVKRRL
jgi:hypothetical protein